MNKIIKFGSIIVCLLAVILGTITAIFFINSKPSDAPARMPFWEKQYNLEGNPPENGKFMHLYNGDKIAEISENEKDLFLAAKNAQQVCKSWVEKVYTRDYKTMTGEDEYEFYSEEYKNSLLKQNDPEETLSFCRKLQLVENLKSLRVDSVDLIDYGKDCKVYAEATVEFLNGDIEEYKNVYKKPIEEGKILFEGNIMKLKYLVSLKWENCGYKVYEANKIKLM